MPRKLENYKKGDIVYVHSTDTREKSYIATVTSVGPKYITVSEKPDNKDWKGVKFSIENGHQVDWYVYELFHTEAEYIMFYDGEKIRKKFIDMAERHMFSDEEIIYFLDVHATGIPDY